MAWFNEKYGGFGLWWACPQEKDEEGNSVKDENGLIIPTVPVAWGARAILNQNNWKKPIDLLWDRQTLFGESEELREAFCQHMNDYVIPILQVRVDQLLHGKLNEKNFGDETAVDKSPDPTVRRMSSRDACLFTLFEDASVKVLANTNASFGYLYLIAFPVSELSPDNSWIRENEDPDFNWRTDARWSGRGTHSEPPEPGTRVSAMSGEWQGIVLNQFIMHGYIHISVICDKIPEWKQKELDGQTRYHDHVNPRREWTDDDSWQARGKTYGVEIWPNGRPSKAYVAVFIGGDLDQEEQTETQASI